MPEYPEPRPEWVASAEEKGLPAPTFPNWVHQRPESTSAPQLPPQWEPDPWTARQLAFAPPNTPLYGSEEWKALPDADPRKEAAVVRAAAAWAAERDPQVMAARLQTEIQAARAEAERVQMLGTIEAVTATADRLAQRAEPFGEGREVVQTPDWPTVAAPPAPAPVVELRSGPAQPQPRVPAAYVTAETGPVPAAAAAPPPVDLAAVVTEQARAAAQQQRTPGARDYRQRVAAAGPPRAGRGR